MYFVGEGHDRSGVTDGGQVYFLHSTQISRAGRRLISSIAHVTPPAKSTTGSEPRTAPSAPWNGGRPRAAAAGGAVEPDALRGARRAGPQFPRPSRASHPCRGA